ncbi:DUF2993 domain-containing protein [Solihabitans fulvus]|uniref:DUF2993 domain-containing protein n=1 Tax=Solihabitans fulvus TaxID=1892852 RepID=A0A5B2XE39_9PSEU|nr:DUF2993 domain-containing protein [Solihabitans fulvus]
MITGDGVPGPHGDNGVRRPHGRRGSSRLKKLVITLVVLVALLVAADFGVAAAAEYQVAQKMRTQLKLTDDPSVRINGFPFITQALAGDYEDVQISASGVPVRDQLRDLEIQAHLHHVRIGLSDLLGGNTRNATVDDLEGSVTIKASDIARLASNSEIPITDLTIDPDTRKPEDGGPTGKPDPRVAPVKLTGNTTVAGKKIKITAYGTVTLLDTTVQIAAGKVAIDDQTLPGLNQLLSLAARAFSIDIKPGELPFTVTPTEVRVDSGSVTVKGRASNVRLNGATTGG